MRGLVIVPGSTKHRPIPDDKRPFGFFFEPILPDLARFHWISEQSPVQWIDEGGRVCQITELVEYESTDRWAHFRRGQLLPRFSAFVKEDWNNLYGFLEQPNPGEFVRSMEPLLLDDSKVCSSFIKNGRLNSERYAARVRRNGCAHGKYIAQHVDVCFFNVDGAWWELYASDERLINQVEEHLRYVVSLRVTEPLLERRL